MDVMGIYCFSKPIHGTYNRESSERKLHVWTYKELDKVDMAL